MDTPNHDSGNLVEGETQQPGSSVHFGLWLIVVALFFLVFAINIRRLGVSDQNDPGPRAFPVLLSLVLLAGGLVQVGRGWRGRNTPLSEVNESAGSDARGGRDALLLGSVLVFYLLIVPWAGFYAPTFVFAWLMTWWLGARWWAAGSAAGLLLVVIRLLFVKLFRVQLPQGYFDNYFEVFFAAIEGYFGGWF